MKIVLATGIYPPDIGGPATYCRALAREFTEQGSVVTVITYGNKREKEAWEVITVSKSLPIFRWWLYAQALKKYASGADTVIAFSSVSVGVPLRMAKLSKPKKILRLGGDFFWERYTARGGTKGLLEWYTSRPASQSRMQKLLNSFDHIVFSTELQQGIYEEFYSQIPPHSVIENAVPSGIPMPHKCHDSLRVLFMGRFVGFKNLPALVKAVAQCNRVSVTFVGEGPMKALLQRKGRKLHLEDRLRFLPSVGSRERFKVLSAHDLLVIPSFTEISPNVALEARAAGLPVLLTTATGLSEKLTQGMILRDLSTFKNIAAAIQEVIGNYSEIAEEAAKNPPLRGWGEIAEEFMQLTR